MGKQPVTVSGTTGAGDLTVEAALQGGYTLPASWYTSADQLAMERQQVFGRYWQYAGLAQDLKEPGDFLTYTAGNVPVIVLRDGAGDLRGFVNVCRHRGSQLVLQERGTRQSIQCHYHAWTYGLDGSLRAAPGSKAEPGFCLDEFSLLPVQVDTWGPFVFVNPDRTAPPLRDLLGELPRLVEDTGVELDRLERRRRVTYETAADWKVVVDNFLECYHCPVAHPSFCDVIDVNDYTVTEYEYFSTQTAPMRERAGGEKTNPCDADRGVTESFHAYLWPNFMINIYPGPGNVSLNLILPTGTGRSRAVYDFCFVEEVGDDEAEDFMAFVDQVQKEDIELCESVQRGLGSGYFDRGKLLLTREKALQHFQLLVWRALST